MALDSNSDTLSSTRSTGTFLCGEMARNQSGRLSDSMCRNSNATFFSRNTIAARCTHGQVLKLTKRYFAMISSPAFQRHFVPKSIALQIPKGMLNYLGAGAFYGRALATRLSGTQIAERGCLPPFTVYRIENPDIDCIPEQTAVRHSKCVLLGIECRVDQLDRG